MQSLYAPIVYEKPSVAVDCPRSDYTSIQVCKFIEDIFPLQEEERAKQIFEAESGFRNIQSQAIYKKDHPKWGVKAGDRELSWGVPQAHRPAHPNFDYERLTSNTLQDLRYGVEVGYTIFMKSGWGAWRNSLQRPHIKLLFEDN